MFNNNTNKLTEIECKEFIKYLSKGTRIGISEQFPEEIEAIRRNLYPEMKKAKSAGKRVRLTRDKLFIDVVEFKHS
jgi:hypothetical protein